MLTEENLIALRKSLERERDQLRREIGEMTSDAFDENFADSGQVAAEQGEHRILTGNLEDQLGDVDHALTKLDDGTYGTCETDGAPIAFPRLEAFPTARHCIEHA